MTGNGKGTGAQTSAAKPVEAPAWPEHFPKSCPESESAPAVNGFVYRFERGEVDWQSWFERKLGTTCESAGLSCFVSLDAARATKAMQRRWEKAKIVGANLHPEHGRLKQTGKVPSHHSLWLTRKALAARSTLFRDIE